MTDDWAIDGPGMKPALPDWRAGTSPYRRLRTAWKNATADIDVAQTNAPLPVFNKHVKELLTLASEEAIVAAFQRFAGEVMAGKVQVPKAAWFVFYGRRQRYLSKKLVAPASGDTFVLPEYDFDDFQLPEYDLPCT